DQGTWQLFDQVCALISEKTGSDFRNQSEAHLTQKRRESLIPPSKVRYLAEISASIRDYNQALAEQAEVAHQLQALTTAEKLGAKEIASVKSELEGKLAPEWKKKLSDWPVTFEKYQQKEFPFTVRDKV